MGGGAQLFQRDKAHALRVGQHKGGDVFLLFGHAGIFFVDVLNDVQQGSLPVM